MQHLELQLGPLQCNLLELDVLPFISQALPAVCTRGMYEGTYPSLSFSVST